MQPKVSENFSLPKLGTNGLKTVGVSVFLWLILIASCCFIVLEVAVGMAHRASIYIYKNIYGLPNKLDHYSLRFEEAINRCTLPNASSLQRVKQTPDRKFTAGRRTATAEKETRNLLVGRRNQRTVELAEAVRKVQIGLSRARFEE